MGLTTPNLSFLIAMRVRLRERAGATASQAETRAPPPPAAQKGSSVRLVSDTTRARVVHLSCIAPLSVGRGYKFRLLDPSG